MFQIKYCLFRHIIVWLSIFTMHIQVAQRKQDVCDNNNNDEDKSAKRLQDLQSKEGFLAVKVALMMEDKMEETRDQRKQLLRKLFDVRVRIRNLTRHCSKKGMKTTLFTNVVIVDDQITRLQESEDEPAIKLESSEDENSTDERGNEIFDEYYVEKLGCDNADEQDWDFFGGDEEFVPNLVMEHVRPVQGRRPFLPLPHSMNRNQAVRFDALNLPSYILVQACWLDQLPLAQTTA